MDPYQSHRCSQPSVIQIPGYPLPSLASVGTSQCSVQTYVQEKHPFTKNKNKGQKMIFIKFAILNFFHQFNFYALAILTVSSRV